MLLGLHDMETGYYEYLLFRETLAKVNAIPLLPAGMYFLLNWTVVKWYLFHYEETISM